MAKSLIRNTIAGKTYGFIVPADDVNAKAFADVALEGEYAVYANTATTGNENEANVLEYTITGRNASGKKETFSFYAPSTKTEADILTALKDKTFNGVKFEQIFIINASVAKG